MQAYWTDSWSCKSSKVIFESNQNKRHSWSAKGVHFKDSFGELINSVCLEVNCSDLYIPFSYTNKAAVGATLNKNVLYE